MAKRLVDESFVTLDIGKNLSIEGVVLPQFSTWITNSRGVPCDLVALSRMMPNTKVTLSEAITSADETKIRALVKKELEKSEKKDKKDDLVIVKNVLISLFKALYTKRSFWTNDLSADRSS